MGERGRRGRPRRAQDLDEARPDPRQRRSDWSNLRFVGRKSGRDYRKTRFAERHFVTVDRK
jgi:hypothetical protein